jgi:Phosphotransferase enzyme family
MRAVRADEREWIEARVPVSGPIEVTHEASWATVMRVAAGGGAAWFKACAPAQAFEVPLTAGLSARWPGRVGTVLAAEEDRRWLLLADAGAQLGLETTPPGAWVEMLPRYAELQIGEAGHVEAHLAAGTPDLRPEAIPAAYDWFLDSELPVEECEVSRLRGFAPALARLCEELAARGPAATVQHDDLHGNNLYRLAGDLRVLDWGDASIAHPYMSLVVPYRFLDEVNGVPPRDPWFARLRDAYLEPFGPGMIGTFDLAIRTGAFAHAIAWARQRAALPAGDRPAFDRWYAVVIRRAVARTDA